MEEEKDWHEGHEEQFGYDHYIEEYEKRHDPDHPYCTNWPMTKKEKNREEIQRNDK